jgi:hypothetical protein
MRGSPLLRAALTFLVLLSLAPLLWQMTRPKDVHASTPPTPPKVGSSKVRVELVFTAPPRRVEIKHLAQVIWSKDAPGPRDEYELELPWPKEGVELAFVIEWPENAPLSAMRATITDPGENKIERTIWARGKAEKVLNFP